MATPAFTGVDYLSALSEFPGGPQGLIDAAVERFGDQGLTATPRGDDFSLYVPGEFMSSGRPMNYASTLADPTVGGSYYDYLYSTPAFRDIYTNILSPTLTGLQQEPVASVEPRPIAKAGPAVDPIIGETQQPPPATVPLEPSPRIAEATRPSIPTERQTLESALTATPTTPTQAATPLPVVDRVAELTPPQAEPTPIDTRTAQEKATDEYFDLVNRAEFGGQEILKRPLTRDPAATTAITREVAAERPPTKGLVLDMPLESRYPESTAQQYLRGGLDAFAYSGPQGYADVRQRLLGEPADVFTGPEVDWQRLAQPAPSDIYLETGFPDISVDDILANIPKVDPKLAPPIDWSYWSEAQEVMEESKTFFDEQARDIAAWHKANEAEDESIKASTDRIIAKLDSFYDDLDLKNIGSSKKDFRFYEHPGVQKKIATAFERISGLFKGGAEALQGLFNELTRFVESEGGRASLSDSPFGASFKGLIDIVTGNIGDYDKQKYGDLQPGAFVALALAAQTPAGAAVLGLQLSNTFKDAFKQALNVSAYDSPEYNENDPASFAAAYNDAVEFAGDIMRPATHFVSENILERISKDLPEDSSLREKLTAAFSPMAKSSDFDKYYDYPKITFAEEQGPQPQQDPTGQITPEESTPFSEAPASRREVTAQETATTETPVASKTLEPVKVEYQQPSFVGQGVSAGPVATPVGTLPSAQRDVVETREPISLDIAAPTAATPTRPLGRPLPTGQPTTSNIDSFNRVIPTLDELTFVPDTATKPSPFTGMPVSAGSLDRPMSTLPGVENLTPVEPTAEVIQIDVPRPQTRGATEGTTPFTEVAPRPSLEPVTREPETLPTFDPYTVMFEVPLDEFGQTVKADALGNVDLDKVASWETRAIDTDLKDPQLSDSLQVTYDVLADRLREQMSEWQSRQGDQTQQPDFGGDTTSAENPFGLIDPLNPAAGYKNESDSSSWDSIKQTQTYYPQLNASYNSQLPESTNPQHPQYYGNNPENPVNYEKMYGGPVGSSPDLNASDVFEHAKSSGQIPGSSEKMFFRNDEGTVVEVFVPIIIKQDAFGWSWDYDYNNATDAFGSPVGPNFVPEQGYKTGGNITLPSP